MVFKICMIVHPLLTNGGPPYTAASLAQSMASPETPFQIFTSASRWHGTLANVDLLTGLPDVALSRKMPGRILRNVGMPLAYRKLLKSVRQRKDKSSLVYMFGNVSLELQQKLHSLGVHVVREKFNCARATARKILDEAYASVGVKFVLPNLSDADIAVENEGLRIADGIFCPSPLVAQSILDVGVPCSNLIQTSYGWEPKRFAGGDRIEFADERPVFLFVGSLCVRKGAHILLEAWKKAKTNGRLVIVGDIEPIIQKRYADILSQPDIIYKRYTPAVAAYFRAADWFVFPTLEEGSPLVIYEAMGCGLPVVTTPMGAGSVVRNGIEGWVLAQKDADAWAERLATLSTMSDRRTEMSFAAKERAQEFSWDKVGARRRQLLLERFG